MAEPINNSLLKKLNKEAREAEKSRGIVPVLPARGTLSGDEARKRALENLKGQHKHTTETIHYVDNSEE